MVEKLQFKTIDDWEPASNIRSAYDYHQFQPCDPRTTGDYSPEKMKLRLNTMDDNFCGFRHKVPCLRNGSKLK